MALAFATEVRYARVAGLGMNAAEMRDNPQLTESQVHSLNDDPRLPYADAEFDGACCCVSVQYLQKPVEVFREVGRVLKPGAPFVVTFSNRCFPTKAVNIWANTDDEEHLNLVALYFANAENWAGITSRFAARQVGGATRCMPCGRTESRRDVPVECLYSMAQPFHKTHIH